MRRQFDYNLLSPGGVLRKNPETPNFSPYVADQMFSKARHRAKADNPWRLYDPFAGNGVGLSTVQALHSHEVAYLYGSDISGAAVETARRNLEIVSNPAALNARARQLDTQYRLDSGYRRERRSGARGPETKATHADMARALGRIIHTAEFEPAPYHVFQANAFHAEHAMAQTGGGIDLIFTDPPYSHESRLVDGKGRDIQCEAVSDILSGLRPLLSPDGRVCVMFELGVPLCFKDFDVVCQAEIGKRAGYLLAPR